MTSPAARLLDALNAAGLGGPWGRDRVAIVRNVGALLPPPDPGADQVSSRGFNMVLHAPDGSPEYYCKVRHAGLESAAREADILVRLGRVPGLRSAIPATRRVVAGELHVQVAEYLDGETLATRFPGLSPPERDRITAEVLAGAAAISAASLGEDGQARPVVSLAERAAPALAYLDRLFPDRSIGPALAPLIARAGQVPVMPQHGDLWPGNVLLTSRGWVIIDFELFGEIDLQLYDHFHFLRTSWDLLPQGERGAGSWLESMGAPGASQDHGRRVVADEAARIALGPEQVSGLVAYYVADIAFRLHRRGVPGWMSTRLLREVELLVLAIGPDGELATILSAR